jgi:hypothetical protein
MKSQLILALVGLSFIVSNASPSSAEVKSVHMKIAGYLCGN